MLAWLLLIAAFAWPILKANSRVADYGDLDSQSPRMQLGWLQIALERHGQDRLDRLSRVMRALSATSRRDLPSARTYVSAEAALDGAVDPDDLALLWASPHKSDRSLAAAYGSTNSGSWLSAVNDLPNRGLVGFLARRFAQHRLGLARDPPSTNGASLSRRRIGSAMAVAGWVCLAVYFTALATKRVRWSGHPLEVSSVGQSDHVVWRAVLMRAAHDLATPLLLAVWFALPALAQSDDHDVWWSGTYNFLLLGLTVFAAWIRLGGARLRVGVPPRAGYSWLGLIGWGAAGFLAAMALSSVGELLRAPLSTVFAYAPSQGTPDEVPLDWSRLITALAYACLLAPIVEE